MPVQKFPVNINFAQGLDTKTDPFHVPVGKFLSLKNSVFDKIGQLRKRNGFGSMPSLPDATSTYLTTFNGNLTAIGNKFEALSTGSSSWVNKGAIQPVEMSVLPIIRNNTNQSQCDSVIAQNGYVCTVYTDNTPSGLSYKYVVADSVTGQNIVAPTAIPVSSGVVTGSPRVFLLGRYFIVLFTNVITAVSHLQYIAINISNPTNVTANADIASAYIPATTLSFDAVVVNSNLYIAYNTTSGGQSIKVTYLSTSLVVATPITKAGEIATIMSLTADNTSPSSPVIYISYYDLPSTTGKAFALDKNLNTILAPTSWAAPAAVVNVTSTAISGSLTIYYELSQNYSYTAVASNLIKSKNVTQAGVVTGGADVVRSLGLASKAFLIDNVSYFLGVYSSPYQPTYFLMNSSGKAIAKVAYSNGGGYLTVGLPGVSISDNEVSIPYLIKDLIAAVNKDTNVPSGTQINGIYSQTGINLASFVIGTSNISSSEIGQNLNLSGGFMWSYDGYSPVEQGFHLWPDSVVVTTSAAGGNIADATYYYQVTYEWSDNQGNIFRSAPSIPVSILTAGGGTSTNTINVPTLRVTYKTANPVKIVVYRWSSAQPIYYQVTSLTVPTLNSTSTDSVAVVDTFANTTILGNNIIYTNGGVIENIGPPAANSVFLFDDRLWLIPSENPNLLWFSKQVIENTPVEMSDLLTEFVAPTTSAQGSSGDLKCGAPMDDKAILFKKDSIYYINGNGPDNTGSNNGYSQPTFVTSTVGCENQRSIVFVPQGLMFQSDKGIWLLGRDLSTKYIGAEVEEFNGSIVTSAVNVPGTNQVRFTLDTGEMLMYDYYVNQWGTFKGVPAVSSTLYSGMHTYLNSYGQVFKETIGKYLDGSNPVLMSFKTSWLNLAGLRGYQRAYEFTFLGTYISPHKLEVQVAYDYESPIQQSIFEPDNYSGTWGSSPNWGSGSSWGGSSNIEQFRVFNKKQKCDSYQISVQELFDSSFGTVAGAGLTLSGICAVVGIKKGNAPSIGRSSIG